MMKKRWRQDRGEVENGDPVAADVRLRGVGPVVNGWQAAPVSHPWIHGPFGSDSLHAEDPIEYIHAHRRSVIDQCEIGEDAMSFSDALCSVFRQSPDVTMVGGISQQLIMIQDESARGLASEVMNVDNAIRNLMREKQVQ